MTDSLKSALIIARVSIAVLAIAVALVRSYWGDDRGEMKTWFAVTFSAVAGLAAAAWFVWLWPWH